MEFAVIVLLLLLSAFFSGSEIAFVVANRLRVEVLARRDGVVGPVVRSFMEQPSTFLTTTLVGNNVVNVVFSTLMAFYLYPPLEGLFGESVGLSGPGLEIAILV